MKHLTQAERDEIQILSSKWYSHRQIAKTLWKHHSTIDRELKRNKGRWDYDAHKASHKAYLRRHWCKKMIKKIRDHPELEQYVHEKLPQWRTPEDIAGRWNNEHTDISISAPTIYKYIYSSFGRWLGYYLQSEQHHRKKRIWIKPKRVLIPLRTWITHRPIMIGTKLVAGHYECDLVVWPQWTHACLLVLVEKCSRHKIIIKLASKKPSEVLSILKPIAMKHKIQSITFDNGVEFMKHNELWIPTYFCFPHHPREKPQVERCNKDIRRYFPKKTIFEKISQGEIDRICEILNNKPMKVLWFKTPRELFEQTLHSEVALLTL